MAGWHRNPIHAGQRVRLPSFVSLSLPFPPHQKSDCYMEGMTCIRKWQQQLSQSLSYGALECCAWDSLPTQSSDTQNQMHFHHNNHNFRSPRFAMGLSPRWLETSKIHSSSVRSVAYRLLFLRFTSFVFPFSTKMEAKVILPFDRAVPSPPHCTVTTPECLK